MKKRPPKDPAKAARWRARLKADGELKRAIAARRFGTQGAASAVRHIDPASYLAEPQAEAVRLPPSIETKARERARLEAEASRILIGRAKRQEALSDADQRN